MEKIYQKSQDEQDDQRDEVAEELDLDDDTEERGWENMTTREVGKIDGNMVKKPVGYAEKQMDKSNGMIKMDIDSSVDVKKGRYIYGQNRRKCVAGLISVSFLIASRISGSISVGEYYPRPIFSEGNLKLISNIKY